MNLLLILTAMLSALTGIGRPVAHVHAAVEATQSIVIAQTITSAMTRPIVARPDGYVAPVPLWLDLSLVRHVSRSAAPERRRE